MAENSSLKKPETSLVIRTRNEEKYFELCLKAILRQSYKNYEIIVVDSESSDDTLKLAKKYGARILPVKVKDFTYGYALNHGIEKTQGKYIVSLSAHAIPANKEWLQELILPLKNKKTAASTSLQISMKDAWKHVAKDQKKCWPNQKENQNVLMSNASSAFKKEIWEKFKFDEILTGSEDHHWAKKCLKKNYRVEYANSSVVYHSHNENFKQVKDRFYREGLGNIKIGLFKSRLTQAIFSLAQFFSKILSDFRDFILLHYAIIDLKRALSYRIAALIGGVQSSFYSKKTHEKK